MAASGCPVPWWGGLRGSPPLVSSNQSLRPNLKVTSSRKPSLASQPRTLLWTLTAP